MRELAAINDNLEPNTPWQLEALTVVITEVVALPIMVEAEVMAHEKTAHFLEGRQPKKVIVVPGRIVNVVG